MDRKYFLIAIIILLLLILGVFNTLGEEDNEVKEVSEENGEAY